MLIKSSWFHSSDIHTIHHTHHFKCSHLGEHSSSVLAQIDLDGHTTDSWVLLSAGSFGLACKVARTEIAEPFFPSINMCQHTITSTHITHPLAPGKKMKKEETNRLIL
jgi:hypothetical protein